MSNKKPIRNYLAYRMRMHGKLTLQVLLLILGAGIVVSLAGFIPQAQGLVSTVVSDIPVKLIFFAAPAVLIFKSKTYSQWHEYAPKLPMKKKDFINATYLEIFLSSLYGIPVLAIIWLVASLVHPGIVDFNEGLAVAGGSFGIVLIMTGLVYSLQFTKLGKSEELLLSIGFFGSFGFVFLLQVSLFRLKEMLLTVDFFSSLGFTFEFSQLLIEIDSIHTISALAPVIIGLIVFLICLVVSIKLQEKVD